MSTISRLYKCASLINSRHSDYSILDVGCRTMDLKKYLNGYHQYTGTDLTPSEGVVKCDLNFGLKEFSNNSFDVVVALDVLEHLDDPFFNLSECLRVARKSVYISLPNMHYFEFRFNLLFGKGISGKYKFPTSMINDRHKWFLSYEEACQFIEKNTLSYKYNTYKLIPARGRFRHLISPVQSLLAQILPNLFVYGVLFEIKKDFE
jgi:SAM-dependent methyltransferase